MVEIPQNIIYVVWAGLIVIFGVVETATAQLVSIWFVIGAAAALVTALCGGSLPVQIIVFVLVTVLALVFTRPLVKKYIHPKRVKTNADKVLGQYGIVVTEINNIESAGQVKADGKIWSARSADNSIIPPGTEVVIEKIEGVKLIVNLKK